MKISKLKDFCDRVLYQYGDLDVQGLINPNTKAFTGEFDSGAVLRIVDAGIQMRTVVIVVDTLHSEEEYVGPNDRTFARVLSQGGRDRP